MQNYDLLVERIAKSSGLEKGEIERRVEAKKAKLSGLISKEGAAQIIAAELGVNFDNAILKVSELMPGMKKVSIIGKIINLFPVREYNKNGKSGKVANFILADETGNIRVVLWDTNHIGLIENGELVQGDVVEIKNAMMRESELHLSGFSEMLKSKVEIENVKTERSVVDKKILDIRPGESVRIKGTVVQLFNPRFFNVCPQCGKKLVQDAEGFSCAAHGRVAPRERALLNFVLDDGTETIRAVMFSEQIARVVEEEKLKTAEGLIVFREDFLGSEMSISGTIRKNEMFNSIEVNVADIGKVDVDKLIEELEKAG